MSIKEKPSFKNFIANIPLLISGVAFITILSGSVKDIFSILVVTVLLAVGMARLESMFDFWRKHLAPSVIVSSVVIIGLEAYLFFEGLNSNSGWTAICEKVAGGRYELLLSVLVVLVGGIAAFYFCSIIFEIILSKDENLLKPITTSRICKSKIYIKALRAMVGIGFILLIICSFSAYLWIDEAASLRFVQYSYRDIMLKYSADDVYPPLYYFMLKLVLDLFSNISGELFFTVTVARLFSIVPYVLTAILCWRKLKCLREDGGRELLLVCMFSSVNIYNYGIEIRAYSWCLFFVTAVYLYAKDIMDGSKQLKPWILLAFFTVCSAYTHYFALVAAAAVWFYLLIWIVRNDKSLIKKYLVFGIASAVAFLPWISVLLGQVKKVSDNWWVVENSIVINLANWVRFIFPNVLCVVLVIFIVYVLENKKEKRECFCDSIGFLIPFTVIAVGLVAWVLIRPIFTTRYIIPSVFCLWISVLLMWQRLRENQKTILVLFIALGFVAASTRFAYTKISLNVQAKDSLTLMQSMSEDSAVCVAATQDGDSTRTSHIVRVVAQYTDKTVYYCGDDISTGSWWDAFSNVQIMGDDSILDSLLEEDTTVYYISADEINSSNISSIGTGSYLGKYLFEYNTFVYEISPLEQ